MLPGGAGDTIVEKGFGGSEEEVMAVDKGRTWRGGIEVVGKGIGREEGKMWSQRGSVQGETVVEREAGEPRIKKEENKREGYDQEEGEE